MDLEQVKAVIELARDSGVAELEVSSGEDSVRVVLARGSGPVVVADAQPPAVPPDAAPSVDASAAVTAPMAGTFYRAPHPDAEPFTETGRAVAVGDVVCIIESMKMMHEIRSDAAGTVTQVCVDNGTPVGTGEVLFRLS